MIETGTSAYRGAWVDDADADFDVDGCGGGNRMPTDPRRRATTHYGEVRFNRSPNGAVGDDGATNQFKNEQADLPEQLRKPHEPEPRNRSPKADHGRASTAATGWFKSNVPANKREKFATLARYQFNAGYQADKGEDYHGELRKEDLWRYVTNMGIRGTARNFAYRMARSDPYRSSSWNVHHGGLSGLAVGYAAVALFDSEQDARDALLDDCDHEDEFGNDRHCSCDVFRSKASAVMGSTPEALSTVKYAWKRARERDDVTLPDE